MSTLVSETIQINNKDVVVYKIAGHPTDTTIVLEQDISTLDLNRLNAAVSGDLKKRDITELEGVEVTDDLLNILQAFLPEVNMWATDYFKYLLKKLEHVTVVNTKSHISNHTVEVVYNLLTTEGQGTPPGTDVTELIEAVAADVRALDSGKADKVHEHTISDVTGLDTALDGKVDKEVGKGLSDTNFTQAEKDKLSSLESSKFVGLFVNEGALPTTGSEGDYANVDGGVGGDVYRVIWDSSDSKWVRAQGVSTELTDAQIKQQYESNPDTNAFTDDEKTKLTGVASGATKNRADSDNADKVHEHTISDVTGLATRLDEIDALISGGSGSGSGSGSGDGGAIIDDNAGIGDTDVTWSADKSAKELVDKVDKEVGKGLSDANFTQAEKDKLSSLESSKFVGLFVSESALPTTGSEGDYANVDGGVGGDVYRVIWDSSDSKWVKLEGVSTDLTPAQIKQQYESNPDTNAFTDDQKAKLTDIEVGATKNRSDSENADKSHDHTMTDVTGLAEALDNKVDAVEGKGLSSNDFTTALKDKLDSIDTEVQPNVNADWLSSAGDSQILNKPTLGTVSSLDTGVAGEEIRTNTQAEAFFVAKVPGKGLSDENFTQVEKTKLTGIADEATKNRSDSENADKEHTHTWDQVTGLDTALESKVDKEVGKGLSDTNFTQAEKDKLSSLESSKFVGLFVNESALPSTGGEGDYANVDGGVGGDVYRVIWDTTNSKWVVMQGVSTELTGAQIKQQYESNPDTNAYTDAEKTKLAGVATGATKNRADSQNADKVHTHTWDQVTGQPVTATRWPTFDEVTGKPTNYSTTWAEVMDKPTTFTPATHTHTTAQIIGLDTALSGKASTSDPRFTGAREWSAVTVTQLVAETGTSTDRLAFTPQRVRQSGVATVKSMTAQTTGQSTTDLMSQKATTDAIAKIESVSKTSAYTVVAADKGKSIDTTSNVTIPASVFTVGDIIVVTNTSSTDSTIIAAAGGVTIRLAGSATTGTRTLAGYGVATLRMVSNNVWFASGAGLS